MRFIGNIQPDCMKGKSSLTNMTWQLYYDYTFMEDTSSGFFSDFFFLMYMCYVSLWRHLQAYYFLNEDVFINTIF